MSDDAPPDIADLEVACDKLEEEGFPADVVAWFRERALWERASRELVARFSAKLARERPEHYTATPLDDLQSVREYILRSWFGFVPTMGGPPAEDIAHGTDTGPS